MKNRLFPWSRDLFRYSDSRSTGDGAPPRLDHPSNNIAQIVRRMPIFLARPQSACLIANI
jgi:hypothetical protein